MNHSHDIGLSYNISDKNKKKNKAPVRNKTTANRNQESDRCSRISNTRVQQSAARSLRALARASVVVR